MLLLIPNKPAFVVNNVMRCNETHGFAVEHAQYTLTALYFPTFVDVTEIMGHPYGKSVPEFQMDCDDPANRCMCEGKA